MKTKKLITTLLVLSAFLTVTKNLSSQSEVTLIQWINHNTLLSTNPDVEKTKLTSNTGRKITCNFTDIQLGKYYVTESWRLKKDTGWWQFDFETTGYENIQLSFQMSGYNQGPRDFRVEWRLDGTDWIPASSSENGNYSLSENNWYTNTFTLSEKEANPGTANQGRVYVRLINTSNSTIKDGTSTDNADSENYLKNVIVTATVPETELKQYTIKLEKDGTYPITPVEGTYCYNEGTEIKLKTTLPVWIKFEKWEDVGDNLGLSTQMTDNPQKIQINGNCTVKCKTQPDPNTEVVLIGWTFSTGSNTGENPSKLITHQRANLGITGNIDVRTIRRIPETAAADIKPEQDLGVMGGLYNSLKAKDWADYNVNNRKYWIIDFSTTGFKDIKLESRQRGTVGSPKDWTIQYRFEGTDWKNFPTPYKYEVTTMWNGAMVRISLPAECNNQEKVYVRWVTTSGTGINQTTTAADKPSYITNIYVRGKPYPDAKQYKLSVYSSGGGKVNPPEGVYYYNPGTTVCFTAEAFEGYKKEKQFWTGNIPADVNTNNNQICIKVDKDMEIMANYEFDYQYQFLVVGFDFSTYRIVADLGVPANREISTITYYPKPEKIEFGRTRWGNVTLDYIMTSSWKTADNWQWKAPEWSGRYWQIEFNAKNFYNLDLWSSQYSSSNGPRDFEIQYRTKTTEWKVLDNIQCVWDIADNHLIITHPANVTKKRLGLECNDSETVYIRWVCSSPNTPKGSSFAAVTESGVNQLANIFVRGTMYDDINVWTGEEDENWNNPKNWNLHKLPDHKTDVKIRNCVKHFPVIYSEGGKCRDIIIEKGAKIFIDLRSILNVYRNVTSSGTINNKGFFITGGNFKHTGVTEVDSRSWFIFKSDNPQNISGLEAYNLIFEGLGEKRLSDNITIHDIFNYSSVVKCQTSNITFLRNFDYNGTFFKSDKSTVILGGKQQQILSATTGSIELYGLTVDMKNDFHDDEEILLSSDLKIFGKLTLINGVIKSGTPDISPGMLIIEAGGTTSEGNDMSYVSGTMRKIGNDRGFKFPLGADFLYSPLHIDYENNASYTFEASYNRGIHPNIRDFIPLELKAISKLEWWDLTPEKSDTPSPKVTLNWNNNSESGIYDPKYLTIVHHTYNEAGNRWQWDTIPAVGEWNPNRNKRGGSVQSMGAVSSFSPFTFGSYNSTIDPLPVELKDFKGKLTSHQTVMLEWTTASERNSNRFEIEHSIDGIKFDYTGFVLSAGNSSWIINYHFEDTKPNLGTNYYRLHQIDNDGKDSYSKILKVDLENIELQVRIFPNPTENGKCYLEFNRPVHSTITLVIYNISGGLITQRQIDMNGKFIYSLSEIFDEIDSGVYQINVLTERFNRILKVVR